MQFNVESLKESCTVWPFPFSSLTVVSLNLLLFGVFLSCASVIAMLFCDSLCKPLNIMKPPQFCCTFKCLIFFVLFWFAFFFEHFLMYWKSKFDCGLIALLEVKGYFHNISKIITQLWINMNYRYLINSLCDKRRHQFTICCS